MVTIEDVLDGLANMKLYSTFDVKAAFFQIPIDDDCSKLLGIRTSACTRIVKRLPMGALASAGILQEIMDEKVVHPLRKWIKEKKFKGNVFCFRDNIIVGTMNVKEHDDRYREDTCVFRL
jgi:hypothetical protein